MKFRDLLISVRVPTEFRSSLTAIVLRITFFNNYCALYDYLGKKRSGL